MLEIESFLTRFSKSSSTASSSSSSSSSSFSSFSFSSFSSSFSSSSYLPSTNLGLTSPGTYKPNARRSEALRGSNSLWTRTLDRYTRAGLPECVVNTMSGPPPKTKQDRTQRTHTLKPRTEIKIPDLAGNRTRAAGLEGRDSTDHTTATD